MATVYLGIGSNVGNREVNCKRAISRLQAEEGVQVVDRSSLYETLPVGGPPQGIFINGVLKLETPLSPREIISILKDIESDMGREEAPPNYPRVLDLDILFYDDAVLKEKELTIPHPRMHERSFVLRGLAEIAPGKVHPELGKRVEELYKAIKDEDHNA